MSETTIGRLKRLGIVLLVITYIYIAGRIGIGILNNDDPTWLNFILGDILVTVLLFVAAIVFYLVSGLVLWVWEG